MGVVEEIISLMRMAESENDKMATLAKMVLGLVEHARDCEARIGVAEAALDAERARVAELTMSLTKKDFGEDIRSRARAMRRLATA